MKVSVVAIETVAFAITRVEKSRRQMLARVQITARVEVQIAVVVVVSSRRDNDEITITGFDYSR